MTLMLRHNKGHTCTCCRRLRTNFVLNYEVQVEIEKYRFVKDLVGSKSCV